jgi:hypothetical protein
MKRILEVTKLRERTRPPVPPPTGIDTNNIPRNGLWRRAARTRLFVRLLHLVWELTSLISGLSFVLC